LALDQTPLASPWLKSDVQYAAADAAIRFKIAAQLREHTAKLSGHAKRDAKLAADLLDEAEPNREFIALTLTKLVINSYESIHLEHLARKDAKAKAQQP
jgi:hypothetical protein